MPVQGVRRPSLPNPAQRYDERIMRRTIRLIEQFMLEVHGRFLNDQTVVVESWDGGALVVNDNDTPTSDHTLLTQSKNGVYVIDATLTADPSVAGTQTATFAISVVGKGTFATYAWPVPASGVGTIPVQLVFEAQTLVAGDTVRISGSGTDSGLDDWSATLTPARIRGQ